MALCYSPYAFANGDPPPEPPTLHELKAKGYKIVSVNTQIGPFVAVLEHKETNHFYLCRLTEYIRNKDGLKFLRGEKCIGVW